MPKISISCRTGERMIYFQDLGNDSLVVSNPGFSPVFKANDFLSIVIMGEDEESSKIYKSQGRSFFTRFRNNPSYWQEQNGFGDREDYRGNLYFHFFINDPTISIIFR